MAAPAARRGLVPPAAAAHHPLSCLAPAGTVWTAVAHIFCAVVGAGVLGLPNSVAWLGWVAGPICLVVFFVLSLWSSHLLAQLYCVDGIEFARYHHAVQHILVRGGRRAAQCGPCLWAAALPRRRRAQPHACTQGNTAAKVLAVFQATNLVMVNIGGFTAGAWVLGASRSQQAAAQRASTGCLLLSPVGHVLAAPLPQPTRSQAQYRCSKWRC